MDAKGIASSEILSNLQIIIGEEKKLLFVPDDIVLNKALTSTIHYLYSFNQYDSGYLGAYSSLFQSSGQHSRKGSCQGGRQVWQPFGQDTGLWSQPRKHPGS